MKLEKARYYAENMEEVVQKDRVFLNNPVIFHSLGLAPLVVVDVNAFNAVMLFVAVLFLLTPVRTLSNVLTSQLGEKYRPFLVCGTAALCYIPVYFLMHALFRQSLLSLGIYLPMLVAEPLILQRFEHVPDPSLAATARKAAGFTLGYGLVLLILGLLREFLAAGTLFGLRVISIRLLPIASLPEGGFLILGLLCAAWVGAVNHFKKRVNMEAKRGL